MKLRMVVAVLLAGGISSAAFAQQSVTGGAGNPTISSGTQSQAQQTSSVNNTVEFPSGGPSSETYGGSYTVRTTPTVYAPSLTASVTETCWGSVSAGVSVVGVGVTGGATIKDLDCNKRLNAAVAWKMDRKDISFNIMCQEDDFYQASLGTTQPCRDKNSTGAPPSAAAQGTQKQEGVAVVEPATKSEPTDPFVRARENLPPLAAAPVPAH